MGARSRFKLRPASDRSDDAANSAGNRSSCRDSTQKIGERKETRFNAAGQPADQPRRAAAPPGQGNYRPAREIQAAAYAGSPLLGWGPTMSNAPHAIKTQRANPQNTGNLPSPRATPRRQKIDCSNDRIRNRKALDIVRMQWQSLPWILRRLFNGNSQLGYLRAEKSGDGKCNVFFYRIRRQPMYCLSAHPTKRPHKNKERKNGRQATLRDDLKRGMTGMLQCNQSPCRTGLSGRCTRSVITPLPRPPFPYSYTALTQPAPD